MKRQAIALQDIAERGNLLLAVHKAARAKHLRPAVAGFLADLDARLATLAASILDRSAPVGAYRSFTIHDPKRRQIHAACFADRALHHAILNLAEPRFERMLVDSSYACRPGKGVHAAVARAQHNLRRFDWVVQVDVDGYFPAICHTRLKALLATRFKGDGFLALLGRIIDNGGTQGSGVPEQALQKRGLPIGSLTSQHFANAYLDAGDRWLLAQSTVRAHVRYMDDILWWCDSRAAAQATLAAFAGFLRDERGLTLKSSARVVASGAGLAYCGFRVRPGVVLPSQRKLTRYRQHAARIEHACAVGAADDRDLQRAAASAHAALAHCHSAGFRQAYWQQYPSVYDACSGPTLQAHGGAGL